MRASPLARRAGWGFADQGLSSLTNFGVGVLVARSVSAEDFGAFSLAFVTYIVALITSRALVSEPFLIRHSLVRPREWRWAASGSAGLALAVGALASVIVAAIGAVLGGRVGEAFLALALVLPALLLLDMWRFAFVAQGRPDRTFLCDATWAIFLFPSLVFLGVTGQTTLGLAVLAWGGSGAIGAVIGLAMARTLPSLRLGIRWWHRQIDLGPRFVAEALISMAAQQVTVYALGAMVGLVAAGALRGGQLLLGPMQVLLMGITLIGIPEGSRVLKRGGPAGLIRPAVFVSLAVSGATLAWGAVLHFLPPEIGRALLGETWPMASVVILPLALAYAGITASTGAGIGIRVLADARRSLRARSADAIAQVTGGIGGAALGGVVGAALGLAVGSWIGAVAIWLMFRAAVRAADGRTGADVDLREAVGASSRE